MRIATVHDIVRIMEVDVPVHLAEAWDNVGLQVGHGDWTVHRIWVALDAARAVVEGAVKHGVDMLITHHPLLFKPLQVLDLATPAGHLLDQAIRNRLAVYSAHTNLDRVKGGVNDILAEQLGLPEPLVMDGLETEKVGFLRMGSLASPLTLGAYAERLKKNLGLSHVRFVGNPDMRVQKVALCAGSGSGFVDAFLSADTDVFVSGDFRYHDARKAEDHEKGLIDIGHFGSEQIFLESWAKRIGRAMRQNNFDVEVERCPLETDPFAVL